MDVKPVAVHNTFLAFCQDGSLPGDFCQPSNYLAVPSRKSVEGIWNARVLTECLHQLLRLAQVMSRNSRVEVMYGLKLEPAV